MINNLSFVKNLFRTYLSGESNWTFYSFSGNEIDLDPEKNFGLYLHVPFCKTMCLYCPYYKVYFRQELAEKYINAVIDEIKMYAPLLRTAKLTTLYIGGGTPTLIIDGLMKITGIIRRTLGFDGPIGIETTPADINEEKIAMLMDMGVKYLSIGVQSFHNRFLQCMGRDYESEKAIKAVEIASKYKFDTLNIDMIFAFPGEGLKELKKDMEIAVKLSPDQITCYPLFTFPYSTIGRFLKLRRLRLPPINVRRKMYYFLHDFLEAYGYRRTSVWSFTRYSKIPYSSVTRDYYVGFGPGAGSYTGERFYFNTFSIEEYVKALEKRLPIALEMKVSKKLEKLFWLYWRLYETVIPIERYSVMFGSNIYKDFGFLLNLIKFLGFVKSADKDKIVLNKYGCHWIHLLQNYFALDYVSKIWSVCQKNPWPEKVKL